MNFLAVAVDISLAGILAGFFLTLVRVYRGPTTADRVVALDLMAFLVVSFIAVFCIKINDPIFMNGAIILALIAFLGTVGFARYLEARQFQEVEKDRG